MNSNHILMKTLARVLVGLLAGLSFFSCRKDAPDLSEEGTNDWIYRTMSSYYLWDEDLPKKEDLDFSQSPEDFFHTLLSKKDGVPFRDTWLTFSTIEKKKESTKAIDPSDTYGFEYASFKAEQNFYAWVLYVLPGSPAAEAGLRRGDWIVAIGSEKPNITDRKMFDKGGETTFQIARLETDRFVFDRKITIGASRTVEETPFLKDSVYSINGKRIGYMVYNSFVSGPEDENTTYDEQMKQIFGKFKSQQVTDFVLDLRYNQGGLLESARLLTSLLAPAEALGKTFCKLVYNEKHTSDNQSLYLMADRELGNINLNLKKIYILTGESTASASEAVINSLIPYMGRENILLIGEKTIGKRVGSSTFGKKEKYDWLLHPIILQLFNADGTADYANGFEPDVLLKELDYQYHRLLPFGDPQELLLHAAIDRITGRVLKSSYPTLVSNVKLVPVSLSIDRKKEKGLMFVPY